MLQATRKATSSFFVHGYNTEVVDLERRHHAITKGLKKADLEVRWLVLIGLATDELWSMYLIAWMREPLQTN
nr:hypothetical protein [uncultured Roseobacter sp.]